MRIIEPVQITPSLYALEQFTVTPDAQDLIVKTNQNFMVAGIYSNVPENDYPVWSGSTAYAKAARVILSSRVYEALIANTNVNPSSTATTPATWLDLGVTNRWKMFDDKMSSYTENPESIVVQVTPGKPVGAMAFFGVDAAIAYLKVIDPYEGIIFESQISTVSTDGVNDWYDYFFSPVETTEDFVVADVPAGSHSTLEIRLEKPGGIARVAAVIMGQVAELGIALYGTSIGIIDYSKKEVDEFGNYEIIERGFSKRVEFDVEVDTKRLSSVQRKLAKYRARPLVWIGEPSYESTVVYGYYRDFNLVIADPMFSTGTITVEGLV